jgi:hypothetical protein
MTDSRDEHEPYGFTESPVIARLQAEIARLTAERDEIQRELRNAETESSMLRVECGVIAAERDEARQMYCNVMTDHCEEHEARQIAQEQGWDCFPQEDGK